MDLELEIRNKKTEYEALEAKYRALEAEKLGMEQQLEDLRRENVELKERFLGSEDMEGFGGAKRTERVVDLSEDDLDEDRLTQLMIENKMLVCKKEKAEKDVKAWEHKFRELEAWLHRGFGSPSVKQPLVENSTRNKEKVVDLVDVDSIIHSPAKEIGTLKAAGSASDCTPCKLGDCIKEEVKGDCVDPDADYSANLLARRQLAFEKEKSPGKKIAPSTPAGAKPPYLSIVDISDSDDEPHKTHVQLPIQNERSLETISPLKGSLEDVSSKKVIATKASLKGTNSQEDNEEDDDACKEKISLVSTRKRKRASNIVMSDSENDSDDNIPVGRLKKMNLEEKDYNATASVGNKNGLASPPRTRLAALRKCRGKVTAEGELPIATTETKYSQGISTNVSTEDDESHESGSESEGESLGGFIVNDSDVSRGVDASSESEDQADEKTDFSEILSNLQRIKERKFKWDFEADMLADFGKDTEMCMKAVCALYRQQTSEEKISKGTLFTNCRGFSKFDAFRATNLAEFLIAGDPQGDLQKTVQELEQHDPKAVKDCRLLATRYSKQLFAIYKNKEDPLFLP